MNVVVNGSPTVVADACTVDELALAVAGSRRGTAVAVNGEVVPRSAWAVTSLHAGDRVEVLTARQGG